MPFWMRSPTPADLLIWVARGDKAACFARPMLAAVMVRLRPRSSLAPASARDLA
jgi:hypothetical protein